MKNLALTILLGLSSIGLFGQAKVDSTFSESAITLKTPTGDIFGTLTMPNNLKPVPVVLIVPGSGPTDRNCNSPLGIHTNAYKMLAEGLAQKGIATIRFDKRGIGESKAAMTSESDLRFDTYINDVVGWISLLKTDKRFSKIIVLGHSEGSLLGMVAAERAKVAAFISIAGAGKPADEILQEQLKSKLPPQLMDESNKILDSLRAGKTVSNVSPSLASLYRQSVQPYMISWIKYNPTQEIAKLKIPVLIIQGTTDIQVSVEDAKLLSQAKPDAKLLIIDNMNHVMKEATADIQQNMATYKNPELPLKSGLVEDISNFVETKK
jgi:alpha-beta hydrolase superfamily lysophospholipase